MCIRDRTIIDRCVRSVYREYLSDPRPEKMPILEDLYNELRRQDEKEAQYIATALEIYVTGSLNVFNHRSNVNIENEAFASLWLSLHPLDLLLKEEQTAAYTVEIWKRFRKWGGKLLCVLILHGNTKYAVLIEADTDNQDYQWERTGKGFAILIRVEVSV